MIGARGRGEEVEGDGSAERTGEGESGEKVGVVGEGVKHEAAISMRSSSVIASMNTREKRVRKDCGRPFLPPIVCVYSVCVYSVCVYSVCVYSVCVRITYICVCLVRVCIHIYVYAFFIDLYMVGIW